MQRFLKQRQKNLRWFNKIIGWIRQRNLKIEGRGQKRQRKNNRTRIENFTNVKKIKIVIK